MINPPKDPFATQSTFSRPFAAATVSTHDARTLYRWSVAAVVAANALDVASSWQRPEANPFLAQPGARFGGRQIMIKSAFAGTSLLIEAFAARGNPKLYRKLAVLNFAVAGGLSFTAAYNFHLH